jgi:hypothetical protein
MTNTEAMRVVSVEEPTILLRCAADPGRQGARQGWGNWRTKGMLWAPPTGEQSLFRSSEGRRRYVDVCGISQFLHAGEKQWARGGVGRRVDGWASVSG